MSAAFAPLVPSAPLAANDNDNDGNLKRVRYTANGNLIYNIYNLAGELVHVDELSDGKETDYVRLGGLTVARVENRVTPTYVHSDHLGSPVARSDTGGTVLPRERYTPFGLTLNNPTDLNDQAGFTGHIKDSATGLTYMQARYYDPIIGRFLSVDPMDFLSTGNPAMFNRYSYSFNDPINMLDPDGQHPAAAAAGAYIIYKAKKGAIKGGAISTAVSISTQKTFNGGVSASTTAISGLKGAAVGATHEVTGSGKATVAVAGVAGFIDGAGTHLANGGDLVGALGQGSIVAGIDSAAAAAGVALPGKKGDLIGVTANIGAETAIAKGPDAVQAIFDASQAAGQEIVDSFNDAVDGVGEKLNDFTDSMNPAHDPFEDREY